MLGGQAITPLGLLLLGAALVGVGLVFRQTRVVRWLILGAGAGVVAGALALLSRRSF